MPTVVFKLGGSLLTLPGLDSRLRAVLQLRPAARRLLIVGGGAATDVVRVWDRVHELGDERAHWLALASLGLNDALLAELLPEVHIVHDRAGAQAAWDDDRLPVLASLPFLRAEEQALTRRTERPSFSATDFVDLPVPSAGVRPHPPQSPAPPPVTPPKAPASPPDRLPHEWASTSDSIAAWITAHWPADELVLLKSTDRPALQASSLKPHRSPVDANFTAIAGQVPRISWINVRANPIVVETYKP